MEGWRRIALIHVTLLIIQVIFSGNQIASKIAMQYLHPSVVLGLRCAIAAPIMFLVAKVKENDLLPKTKKQAILVLAMGLFSFGSFELFIFGMQITSVTTGTTLQATSPLWTLLIALALKMEGPSFMKIGGVLCAILGATVSIAGNKLFQMIFGDNDSAPTNQHSDFPSGLLLIANAMFFSGFVTVQKFVLMNMKPLTTAAWNVGVSGFLSLLVATFFFDTIHLDVVPLRGWLSILYISILSMALSYSLLSWAAKQTSTTVVSVYTTVMPVLSPIMSYFMLHEAVTIIQMFGMAITVSGVFLVIRSRYLEEKKRKFLELTKDAQLTSDDVTLTNDTAGLLYEDKKERLEQEHLQHMSIEMEEMEERGEGGEKAGIISFEARDGSVNGDHEEEGVGGAKVVRKERKGGYASLPDVMEEEMREVAVGV